MQGDRTSTPSRTDHDRQHRWRSPALLAATLLLLGTRTAAQTAECSAAGVPTGQACVWTGACEVSGCADLCLANLTRVTAFSAVEDAAWRPGWYELCPRLAELVTFFGAAASAAAPVQRRRLFDAEPATEGARSRRALQQEGDVVLACPSEASVQVAGPSMQMEAERWQAALSAVEAGGPLATSDASLDFVLAAPNQFRVLSSYLVNSPALLAYVAANCTQATVQASRVEVYSKFLGQEDRARVAAGAGLSVCRDNEGAAERVLARLQSIVPACTLPFPQTGQAFCFPGRAEHALYTPENTGCAAALADAYGVPPSPLTAASQHIDAIQQACSAATSQAECGMVDTSASEAALDEVYSSFPYTTQLPTDPAPPALPPQGAIEPLPGPTVAPAPAPSGAAVDTSSRVAGQTQQDAFCSLDPTQIDAGVCEWTGDCAVPGCGGRCQSRLLAASAFARIEDAAWTTEWWEVCPRVAKLVQFQLDRMDGNVPPPPGAGGPSRRLLHDAALALPHRALLEAPANDGAGIRGPACPTPQQIDRVAPALQNVTRNWETVLRAARDGRAVPIDLENIEATIASKPHEFRTLVAVMSSGERMRAYFAEFCADGEVAGGAQALLAEYVDLELAPGGPVTLCRDSGNRTEVFHRRQIEATRACLPPFGQRPSCYNDPAIGVAWTPTTVPCADAWSEAYNVTSEALRSAVELVQQLDGNCKRADDMAACDAVSSNDVLAALRDTYTWPYRSPLADDPEVAGASEGPTADYAEETGADGSETDAASGPQAAPPDVTPDAPAASAVAMRGVGACILAAVCAVIVL